MINLQAKGASRRQSAGQVQGSTARTNPRCIGLAPTAGRRPAPGFPLKSAHLKISENGAEVGVLSAWQLHALDLGVCAPVRVSMERYLLLHFELITA